jgi:hypothetical protein
MGPDFFKFCIAWRTRNLLSCFDSSTFFFIPEKINLSEKWTLPKNVKQYYVFPVVSSFDRQSLKKGHYFKSYGYFKPSFFLKNVSKLAVIALGESGFSYLSLSPF